MPKYPNIHVDLLSIDGNAFSIMGAISRALKQNDVCQEEIDACMQEMRSGNYDHLLQTAMKWVDC